MIVTITGYKFMTQEEGDIAIKSIDDYYGYPVGESESTKHYTMYVEGRISPTGNLFYYLVYSEDIAIVLGKPYGFIADIGL